MKITEVFEPYNHNDIQSERVARRLGLTFHITLDGDTVEHRGYQSLVREATDPELAMWAKLVPPQWVPKGRCCYLGDAVPADRAEMDEIERALVVPGPITMNPLDFAMLRKRGRDHMDFCTDESLLRRGFQGTWKSESLVWVSRSIPVGYYWRGVYEHPRLPTLVEGETLDIPDVDPGLVGTITADLRPFQV